MDNRDRQMRRSLARLVLSGDPHRGPCAIRPQHLIQLGIEAGQLLLQLA